MTFPPPIQTLFNLYPEGTLMLVGGYVREYVLKGGKVSPETEADFATTLLPEASQKLLDEAGLLTTSPGYPFGTVVALVEGKTYEITSTRTEIYSPGSRHPKVKFGASWEEDAGRRDFTLNAIYLPPNGPPFTPLKGPTSPNYTALHFIGDPQKRLAEDPLRLLRFARFSAMYGLSGWTDTVNNALKNAIPLLADVSEAKKSAEIRKINGHPHTTEVKKRLKSLGLAI